MKDLSFLPASVLLYWCWLGVREGPLGEWVILSACSPQGRVVTQILFKGKPKI